MYGDQGGEKGDARIALHRKEAGQVILLGLDLRRITHLLPIPRRVGMGVAQVIVVGAEFVAHGGEKQLDPRQVSRVIASKKIVRGLYRQTISSTRAIARG